MQLRRLQALTFHSLLSGIKLLTFHHNFPTLVI
nr:MAG TPA: hypothetical protein [Caudoviricetes sp.]